MNKTLARLFRLQELTEQEKRTSFLQSIGIGKARRRISVLLR